MVLHGGLDLHGDNVYCALMNARYEVGYERRFPNDPTTILAALEPYRERIAGHVSLVSIHSIGKGHVHDPSTLLKSVTRHLRAVE